MDKITMDKGTKVILLVLGGLCIISMATAINFFLSERKTYQAYNQMERKLTQENTHLSETLSASQKEKEMLEQRLNTIDKELEAANRELNKAAHEAKESDKKLKQQVSENKRLTGEIKVLSEKKTALEKKVKGMDSDAFLAKLLLEKASLEVELKSLGDSVSTGAEMLEGVTKEKQDLELRLKEVGRAKEDMESQMEKGRSLANTLSRDLLRAEKNSIKLEQELEQAKQEKRKLQVELREMHQVQASLEGQIVEFEQHLQYAEAEKVRLNEKLADLNNELELKLTEISAVKDMVDRSVGTRTEASSDDIVELPPIIVKAETSSPAGDYEPSFSEQSPVYDSEIMPLMPETQTSSFVVSENRSAGSAVFPGAVPSLAGRVIVINEQHNFVVIDKGKEHGIELGMPFEVYREDKKIGLVEVIETRQKIAACDIVELDGKTQIRTNDLVMYQR